MGSFGLVGQFTQSCEGRFIASPCLLTMQVLPASQPFPTGSLMNSLSSGWFVIFPAFASYSMRVSKRWARTPSRTNSVSLEAYVKFDPGSGPSPLIARNHSRNSPPYTRGIVSLGGLVAKYDQSESFQGFGLLLSCNSSSECRGRNGKIWHLESTTW